MTERRDVAFLTPTFHPQMGGAETYARFLLATLTRRHEWAITVIAGAAAGVNEGAVDGIRVRRPGRARSTDLVGRVAWPVRFARHARSTLERLAPSVVVAQYSALYAAGRYARRAGVPLVALVHDVYGFAENVRWRGVVTGGVRYVGNDRLLAHTGPDAVIVNSASTGAAVRRLTDAPIVVARPGTEHVPDEGSDDRPSPRAIFVGRAAASKGLNDAVVAVSRVRRSFPDARLVAAGPVPSPALPGWVDATGPLDDAALDIAVRASSVLVFPSRREGWGLVVSEAAARGVPYVAYDIPAVREQHELVRGGILVPAGDREALARALHELFADGDRARELGARGRANARRLRWADAADEVAALLARLVGDRHGEASGMGVA